jgi:hypothetical protein
MDESQPMRLRATRLHELAQYRAPKRKTLAVTGADGSPVKTEMTVREWLESIHGQRLRAAE